VQAARLGAAVAELGSLGHSHVFGFEFASGVGDASSGSVLCVRCDLGVRTVLFLTQSSQRTRRFFESRFMESVCQITTLWPNHALQRTGMGALSFPKNHGFFYRFGLPVAELGSLGHFARLRCYGEIFCR